MAEDRAVNAAGQKDENGISGGVGHYRATFEAAWQKRALGDVSITVPILTVGGEYGMLVTFGQFTQHLPNADVRATTLSGAGRLVAEEVPDALVVEIDGFLDNFEACMN